MVNQAEHDELDDLVGQVDSALQAFWQGDSSALERLAEGEDDAGPGLGELFDGVLDQRNVPVIGLPDQSKVGNYTIIREIGRGGMGVVYEAEQQSPRRSVALKVVRGGTYVDEHRVKLFEREARALARLKHPFIGAIHEAGRTDDGQHFFAMEFVRGQPLLTFVRSMKLSIRERLGLFCHICQAINYAHQRGVIHRDLKPSNIMIDAEGNPKILDFGLARITDADATLAATATEPGKIMGTLAYMSPEQARGNPDEIDTRSDVYSLGAILHQLLTDHLPYDVGKVAPHEATRVICEEMPRKPGAINRTLRGDVETIILKALEKEASRRYQSVAALAEDVNRYLMDQPILARPPSAGYRLRKLVARHKVPFGFAAALFVSVTAVAVLTSLLYAQADRDRFRTALAFEFVQDMLGSGDPREAIGRDAELLREDLRKAAGKVRTGLADQPEVAAAVLTTIGTTWRRLGEFDAAKPHLEEALELRRRVLGDQHPDTLHSMNNLASLLRDQGKLSEAKGLIDQTLETCRQVLGDEHAETLTSMNTLALVLQDQGQMSEAEGLYRQTLETRRRTLGEEHPDTLFSAHDLASLFEDQGKFSEAEALCGQVLEARRRVLGEEHPDTLESMNDLALLFEHQGRLSQADLLYREALEAYERVLGDEHPDTLTTMHNLAMLLYHQGKLSEAETLCRRALETRRRVLGDEHHRTLNSINNLSAMLHSQGKLSEAEELFRETLETYRRTLGDEHPRTLNAMNNLACSLTGQGRLAEAETLHHQTLETGRRVLPEDHPDIFRSMHNLASLYRRQGKLPEAEALCREAVEGRRRVLGEEHPDTLDSTSSLAAVLQAQGKLSEAEALHQQTLETRRRVLGDEHLATFTSMNNLAMLLYEQGKLREAETLHRQTLAARCRRLGDEHPHTLWSMNNLAMSLCDQGKTSEAEALWEQTLDTGERALAQGHWYLAAFRGNWGRCLLKLERFEEAEAQLLQSYAGLKDTLGEEHSRTQKVLAHLIDLYEAWGRPKKAAEYRATLPKSAKPEEPLEP